MSTQKKIYVAINTSTIYGHNLLSGISRYLRQQSTRTMMVSALSMDMAYGLKPIMKNIDGIIVRIFNDAINKAIESQAAGIPLINLSDEISGLPFPRVVPDHEGIGRLAAEHLIDCGFRNFWYCGFKGRHYSASRYRGFKEKLAEHGLFCKCNDIHPERMKNIHGEVLRLIAWLRSIEKPAGVFTCNDWRGQHVLLATMEAGIDVPHQLGVLGVDNDNAVCDLCPTSLSSIDSGAENTGFRAAELMNNWLVHGQSPPAQTVCTDYSLVRRRSTDVLTVPDPIVCHALKLMHQEKAMSCNVNEIIKQLHISRRPFEKRFRQATGMTPHQALTRFRTEHAADLLRTTDLTIQQIAEKCGFRFGHHFARTFRQGQNKTPSEYRKKYHF